MPTFPSLPEKYFSLRPGPARGLLTQNGPRAPERRASYRDLAEADEDTTSDHDERGEGFPSHATHDELGGRLPVRAPVRAESTFSIPTSGNIIRLFPLTSSTSPPASVGADNRTVSVGKHRTEAGLINNSADAIQFEFDNILRDASQEEVFTQCGAEACEAVLSGYNATVFAYGQTGAGKTFTMSGDTSSDYKQRGIIPRAVHHVFREMDVRVEKEMTVRCFYREIYNECIFDLLAERADRRPRARRRRPRRTDGRQTSHPTRRLERVRGVGVLLRGRGETAPARITP